MTPNTCPPDWWLSDRLLARKNEQLLERAFQTAERAQKERNLQLAVIATAMFKLHAESEERRLNTLANHMELYGVERVPEEWLGEVGR